jgi:Tfp pilus assembly protein FimT
MAEVVVVLAILGILATASVPTLWTYLRTARLRTAAETTVAVLNGARSLALRTNTTVCVSHDDIHARYHVGGCHAPAWTGAGTDAQGNIRLAEGLRVSGGRHLCFNALGAGTPTPSPCAANGTLVITDQATSTGLSVIMATTGRLRIQ